ncbi:hypothetical protein [Streptomyces sp. NPDC006285]|uniref:hypothetical protein n=1 Tax=Streptomyces sp. NPDC006285 TaxID=3364742 RepID=UPI0036B4626E
MTTSPYKLAVEELTVAFGHGRRVREVLHGVSPGVRAGRVDLDGEDLTGLKGRDLIAVRSWVQLVSQVAPR